MSNPEFQTSCCASRPSLSSGFVQCSESTAMRVQSECPFIDQQNIGGHAPKASDRHCTGRPDSTWAEARAYLELYHREKKIPERLASRLEAVHHEIECTGTYWQTADELAHGARVAWRNSNRCIGRLYWESLRLRDMRHLATEEEIFQSCAEHLREADKVSGTNGTQKSLSNDPKTGCNPR